MMYFLDFDRTLFNVDAFIAHVSAPPDTFQFLGEPEESLARTLEELSTRGAIVFSPGELKPFVYPDVPEFLRMAGNEAVILTYGNPALQRLKVENALAGIPRVSALYTGDVRKGEYMKEHIARFSGMLALVDDRSIELESMAAHCPEVTLFEMRRDGGAGDGRWPVIRSLYDLP